MNKVDNVESFQENGYTPTKKTIAVCLLDGEGTIISQKVVPIHWSIELETETKDKYGEDLSLTMLDAIYAQLRDAMDGTPEQRLEYVKKITEENRNRE